MTCPKSQDQNQIQEVWLQSSPLTTSPFPQVLNAFYKRLPTQNFLKLKVIPPPVASAYNKQHCPRWLSSNLIASFHFTCLANYLSKQIIRILQNSESGFFLTSNNAKIQKQWKIRVKKSLKDGELKLKSFDIPENTKGEFTFSPKPNKEQSFHLNLRSESAHPP